MLKDELLQTLYHKISDLVPPHNIPILRERLLKFSEDYLKEFQSRTVTPDVEMVEIVKQDGGIERFEAFIATQQLAIIADALRQHQCLKRESAENPALGGHEIATAILVYTPSQVALAETKAPSIPNSARIVAPDGTDLSGS